jgi:streptogramin lyase
MSYVRVSKEYSSFLVITILLLSIIFSVHSVPLVNAQPNPGDYIITEADSDELSRITPNGVRSVLYSFDASTEPQGLVIDSAGNYIVAERLTGNLSKITPAGVRTVIYTFIGSPLLTDVAIDSAGNYIVTESGNGRISKITPSGSRTLIYDFFAVGMFSARPGSIAIDSFGDYIITDAILDVIFKITPGGVRTVIYNYTASGPSGSTAGGVAIDSAGDYIVTEAGINANVSRFTPAGVRTVISTGVVLGPFKIAIDSAGNYIVTEYAYDTLTRVTPGGAGTLVYTFSTDSHPAGVAVVPTPPPTPGEFVVVEEGFLGLGGALSRINASGVRSLIYNYTASGPTGAQPHGVTIDPYGNYIVAEYTANVISRISRIGVRAVIYNYTASGPLNAGPANVAIDSSGNYIVTEFNATNVLSKITPSGVRTVIYTFAINANANGVAIDSGGNYIVAEQGANVISKVTPPGVRTVIFNFAAEGLIGGPHSIAIDSLGDYIVTEIGFGSDVITKITPLGVRTMIYNYTTSGPAPGIPTGVAIDSAGDYMITENWSGSSVNGNLSKIDHNSGVRTVICNTFPFLSLPSDVAVVPGAMFTLDSKTDPSGQAWASGTYLLTTNVGDIWSSGPTGDQATTLTAFTPTAENLILSLTSGEKLFLIATSQLWNGDQSIGSSICISRNGTRISGDMYAVGADINHRHSATAIAVDNPGPGTYNYTLDFKTDSGSTAWASGTYLLAVKISDSWSSGATGDQSTVSTVFTPTAESVTMALGSGDKVLLIGTSQLWNDNPSIGSSISISHEGSRISGDMYSVGASVTHRHLATAIAVDNPGAGDHTYTLDFKTDSGSTVWASGTYLLAVKLSYILSSGPTGDQSTISTSFTPTVENLNIGYVTGDKFLVIATSQLWNNNPAIGSSICASNNGTRISGDIYAVGADANHRHLATAIAVWAAP